MLSAMVMVVLVLVAGNFVMLRPGAGEADARETPAGDAGGSTEAGGAAEGTAEPIVLEGSGDAEEEFDPFTEVGFLAVEHSGENLNIEFHTDEEGAVDTIFRWLPYSGSLLVNDEEAAIQGLSITADGDWSIELRPLSDAPEWDGSPLTGDSDAVYQYTGPEAPTDVQVTADFAGYFYLIGHPYENPLDADPPLDETVTFQNTPTVVSVEASVSTDIRSDDPEATPEWSIEVV